MAVLAAAGLADLFDTRVDGVESVRLTLAGGVSVVGMLMIVMPQERSRVVDYLNASGRFLPVYGEGIVTLVQRRYIVTVRSGERASAFGL